MNAQELLRLLKPILDEVRASEGKLSDLEAVEVIEEFKSQIQNEAIEEFIRTYGFLYDKKIMDKAREINSRQYENPKKTLVK